MITRTLRTVILLALILLISSAAALQAAEPSFGAHLNVESNGGGVQVNPGIDFRSLGGRGIFSGTFTFDYFPTNSRGYAGGVTGDLFLLSGFATAQFSFMYGDAAFYAGPGLSAYYISGDRSYLSLTEDSIIHAKVGGLYTFFPMQVFTELTFDMEFGTSPGVSGPYVSVGASLLR